MPPPIPYVSPSPPSRPSSRASRSSRRPSSASTAPHDDLPLLPRLDQRLSDVEHLAQEAEHVAAEAGRAARVGRTVVHDLEEGYGASGRGDGRERKSWAQENYDEKAQDVLGEVARAVKVGNKVVADVEAEYGALGGAGGTAGGISDVDGGAQMGRARTASVSRPSSRQSSVRSAAPPYDAPRSSSRQGSVKSAAPAYDAPRASAVSKGSQSSRQRKSGAPASSSSELTRFERDLDAAQEAVDDLADEVELIALNRHLLTGGTYPHIGKLFKRWGQRPRAPPKSRRVLDDEAVKLAVLVAQAKADLLKQYQTVCALQPRFETVRRILGTRASSAEGDRATARLHRHYEQLNSSFAALLDFVEDHAKSEKKDVLGKETQMRLQGRMRDDHPEWAKEAVLRELKRAEEAAKKTSLSQFDPSSYASWWLIDNPFTELDGVLATIDLAENGIASKRDLKSGTLLSRIEGMFHTPAASKRPPKKRSTSSLPAYSEREVGKRTTSRSSSSSHRYRSEDKPSLSSKHDDVSTDESEASDVEKQLLGAGSGKGADGIDLSGLPERVPTDDTSGYQETPEELLEDAKDQSRTEHFYTPLVVAWWACIAVLYLYWGIARAMGYQNPLGNVDLGSHLGNDAWNDTSSVADLVANMSSSSTEASSTTTSATSVLLSESLANLTQISASASAMQSVMSQVDGTLTAWKSEARGDSSTSASASATSSASGTLIIASSTGMSSATSTGFNNGMWIAAATSTTSFSFPSL
ncbi:hypothetical protein JCM10207_007737 [Rhodosporidiobolus poonsookiae]